MTDGDQRQRGRSNVKKRSWFRPRVAVAAGVAVAVLGATAATGATTATASTVTIYAAPVTIEFMNHADDRIRGMSANPFTPNEQALVLVANGTEKRNGPFPGDDVLYSFKLYSDPGLSQSAGTAMFTCYYLFAKRATCEAYFDLAKGLVVADGQIAFGSSKFTLGVSGGTKGYLGVRGSVTATPAAGHAALAQRLDIDIVLP